MVLMLLVIAERSKAVPESIFAGAQLLIDSGKIDQVLQNLLSNAVSYLIPL